MVIDKFKYLISKKNKNKLSKSLEWKAYSLLRETPVSTSALLKIERETSPGVNELTNLIIKPEYVNGEATFYTPHNRNIIKEVFKKYKIINIDIIVYKK